MTQAAGRTFAADRVPVRWSLDFIWTPLYIQVQLAICAFISGLRRTFRNVAVAQCLSYQICIQADGFIRPADVPHRLSLVEEQ